MIKLRLLMLLYLFTCIQAEGDDGLIEGMIYGGSNAPLGLFPSIGYLVENDGVNKCGATLIEKDWAVTAAHCFDEPEASVPVQVVFGNIYPTNRFELTGSHQESCFDVIIHEDYNKDTTENDIALLRLKQPVNITNYVKPVNLSTTPSEAEIYKECFIAGWGEVENEKDPDQLRYAKVTLQNSSVCSEFSTEYVYDENKMLCAGSETADACTGDSGGPLFCSVGQITSQQFLVGIVSYGQEECGLALDGVYTRVAAYKEWIEKTSAGTRPSLSLSLFIFMNLGYKALSTV